VILYQLNLVAEVTNHVKWYSNYFLCKPQKFC